MLADYFTKPVQGKLFKCLRAVIMGHQPLNWFKTVIYPTKERAGNKIKRDKNVLVDLNKAGIKNVKKAKMITVK